MAEKGSIPKKTLQIMKKDQNPNKFYTRFLCKALAVILFCVLVPLFISQSPELTNQTRLLELLHLIFVGIAVSYGLFSRRNYDGGGKENGLHGNNHSFDNAHSYLSRILHVSSVFDDDHDNNDSESEPSEESAAGGISKVQTWRNRYQMNNSEVVLAKDDEAVVGKVSSRICEKPLLLPVRSLNSSWVSDSGENYGRRRQFFKSLSENSVSKNNNDVLPSPIPWGSRSAGIESQPLIKPDNGMESRPLIKKPASRSLSLATPLANSSSESLAKSSEDSRRMKSLYGVSHPPPPPPPPPPRPAFYNLTVKKDYHGSYRTEPKDPNYKMKLAAEGSSKSFRAARSGAFPPPPPPPPPPPREFYKSVTEKRRVREESVSSDHKMKPSEQSSRTVTWGDPIIIGSNQNQILGNGSVESPKNQNGSDGDVEKLRYYLQSKTIYRETEEEENREILEKMRRESEEENEEKSREESEDEEEGPDVDKKADEFIAKFREQIRLQRIEMIKRSSSSHSPSSSSR